MEAHHQSRRGIHHQSHPEEAVEASKAFQYPLVARREYPEVTKAHPESEDPEVVHHHPALQIRLTCPEQSGVEVEWNRHHRAVYRGIRLAYHRLAAASLHHRLRPYRERELLAAWVAGSDVRPESVSWDDLVALHLALRPELEDAHPGLGEAQFFARLVVRPELSGGGACEAALAYWVACCLVALARQRGASFATCPVPSQFRAYLDDACHGNDGGGAYPTGGNEDPRDPNHDDHDNHAFS